MSLVPDFGSKVTREIPMRIFSLGVKRERAEAVRLRCARDVCCAREDVAPKNELCERTVRQMSRCTVMTRCIARLISSYRITYPPGVSRATVRTPTFTTHPHTRDALRNFRASPSRREFFEQFYSDVSSDAKTGIAHPSVTRR